MTVVRSSGWSPFDIKPLEKRDVPLKVIYVVIASLTVRRESMCGQEKAQRKSCLMNIIVYSNTGHSLEGPKYQQQVAAFGEFVGVMLKSCRRNMENT